MLKPTLQRRHVLKMIALTGATLAAPFVSTPSKGVAKEPKKQKIVVRDAGGTQSKIFNEIFYQPFHEKTGIEVIGVTSDHEPFAQIKAMVENKNLFWDIAVISSSVILSLTAGKKVYLEKHGLEDDPVVSSISPQFRSPYGVGVNAYTVVLAYQKDAFRDRPALTCSP